MTEMKNTFEVTAADSIPEGTMKSFKVMDRDILIARVGGKFYAMGGKCTHRGGDLSKGKLEGTTVKCPLHGARFDITTGKNLAGPGLGPVRAKIADEPAYEVVVEGTKLQVRL
ncbi:MAG: non-heme iron oxygenase ferredoxin subunit [Dehalococcoidales bacterium]|nr:non-heme iron oxygenase ferredoxin subunit [Dehalococcoidales bacterium]